MATDATRIIDLSQAPRGREAWSRSRITIALWKLTESLLVSNPLQPSSRLRCAVLRAFGAKIGRHVIFRPRTKVHFPWNLNMGDNCWIGEGVWIHNQDTVYVGNNVAISQECFITTGTHDVRGDMGLKTSAIHIEDGAWIASRSMITGGVTIGRSTVIGPMLLIQQNVSENTIVRADLKLTQSPRFVS